MGNEHTAKNAFANTKTATEYIEYLESDDGKFQQKILYEAIYERLKRSLPIHRPINRVDLFYAINGQTTPTATKLLDAACGSGWLSGALHKDGFSVVGCDNSEQLLAIARAQFPKITFTTADVTQPLPYPPNSFTSVILNMAAQDIYDLVAAYKNIAESLVTDGKLIVTIPNPYFAFPHAVWKRGILGTLFSKKPVLKFANKKMVPLEGKPVSTYSRSLSEYVNKAITHGLVPTHLQEIRSDTDNKNFGLQYQLYRYPLLLLLEFKKIV